MVMSWQYIAGFFDGEGNIRIASGSGCCTAQLSIHQSAERGRKLLIFIQEFMANYGIRSGLQKQKPGTCANKEMYRLYVYNRSGVMEFIRQVMPYIHIKKLECQDIYRYCTVFPPTGGIGMGASRVLDKCCRGHVLSSENRYRNGGCRPCAQISRTKRYREIIQPIMKATGLGMRQVTKEIIDQYRGKLWL